MCNPISLIMSADREWTPASDAWEHSHTAIAALHKLADGLMGDKFARVEVRPRGDVFRDPATNAVLAVDETWVVLLDEARDPGWWAEDMAVCKDRAREAARRWLADFPAWLVPGYRQTGGDRSTLTGGYGSTLTGGYKSTLTGGNWSTLTGGNWSTLTGGERSTLTGGDRSTLTGGYGSTLTGGNWSTLLFLWWDGARSRVVAAYVGENGVEPNVAYKCVNGKVVKAGGAA